MLLKQIYLYLYYCLFYHRFKFGTQFCFLFNDNSQFRTEQRKKRPSSFLQISGSKSPTSTLNTLTSTASKSALPNILKIVSNLTSFSRQLIWNLSKSLVGIEVDANFSSRQCSGEWSRQDIDFQKVVEHRNYYKWFVPITN